MWVLEAFEARIYMLNPSILALLVSEITLVTFYPRCTITSDCWVIIIVSYICVLYNFGCVVSKEYFSL